MDTVGRFTQRLGLKRCDRTTRGRICALATAVVVGSLTAGALHVRAQDSGRNDAPTQLAPLDLAPSDEDGARKQGGTDSAGGDESASGGTVSGNATSGNGGSGNGGSGDAESGGDPNGGLDDIEVDRLGKLDSATIGVLDPNSGGLGPDMWGETSRYVIDRLLPRLPVRLESPTLRDLARRLLLSGSSPPERRQASANGARNLLEQRVARLMALGHYADTLDLIRAVPRRNQTDPLRRARVAAALLGDESEAACRTVKRAVANSEAAYWQRALAVCQRIQGKAQAADLTVSLLRETQDPDSRFLTVYDAVTSGGDPIAGPVPPMAAALLVHADGPIPTWLVKRASPGLNRTIAGHAPSPLPVRLMAGELAVATGRMQGAELRRLYAAATFPEGLLKAAAQGETVMAPPATGWMSPALHRALRYQAALQTGSVADRARLIDKALTSAGDRYYAVVPAFMPLLLQDSPRPDLIRFAARAGRAFYAVGRPKRASEWLMLAREEAVIAPDAARAMTALWPYAIMADGVAVRINGGLSAWHEAQRGDGPRASLQISLLRAAFQALGERDQRRWLDIAAEAPAPARPVPPAALIHALRAAGSAGRVGEAVMLTVIGLGESGLDAVHPLTLETAIRALRGVDLPDAARRLAIETALANGI